MADKYTGPRGSMPNYTDAEGGRIRVLLQSPNPRVRSGVEGALLEMGVNPFMARHYGRGGDPAEIDKYLADTQAERATRREVAARARVKASPRVVLPWSDELR